MNITSHNTPIRHAWIIIIIIIIIINLFRKESVEEEPQPTRKSRILITWC